MGEKLLAVVLSLAIGCNGVASAQGNAPRALTLADCYRAAAGSNELVAVRSLAVSEAAGRYQQALATVLPHVSYSYSYVRQGISSGTNLPSYFAAPDSTESKVTLTQTVFSGFREYAALTSGKSERRARALEATRARQTLLADVTDAFFTLLERQETLKILNELHAVIQGQVDYLKERAAVGRSRRTDVASALVLLSQNEALIESMKGQVEDARKRLEFVTGIVGIGALDDTTPQPAIAEEAAYTGKAFLRPDVAAAYHGLELARAQVTVARSGFWPSIRLSGDYYLQRSTGRFSGLDWDVALSLTLPLLPQVQTAGAVREAAAKAEETRLQYVLLKRSVLIDIQTAYADARAAVSQQEAYRRALAASEDNLRMQSADYRLNLVSSLDVLSAIQSLQNTRRDYVRAVYNAKRLFWRLRVAAGVNLSL